MRKIVSVLLLVVLFCGLLVGCKKNRVMRDDFKDTTNQLVSMKGFYFKVPKAWEERESSTEKKYYDTEDGMLTVQYAETLGSIFDKAVREKYTEGLKAEFEKFKILETGEEKINGEKAYVQKLKTRVKDSDYDTDMRTFDCGDGVLTFMMSTLNTSEKDYSDDFNKILKSILKEDPFDRTIEEVVNTLLEGQTAGEFQFTTSTNTLKNGAKTEILRDMAKGVEVIIVGDYRQNIVMISIAAKSEEVFPTICTAGLLAMNISSTEVSEFIKGLSPDVLKEMWELDEYMIKSFDGVSYLCAREDMEGFKYRLSLQRDYIGE